MIPRKNYHRPNLIVLNKKLFYETKYFFNIFSSNIFSFFFLIKFAISQKNLKDSKTECAFNFHRSLLPQSVRRQSTAISSSFRIPSPLPHFTHTERISIVCCFRRSYLECIARIACVHVCEFMAAIIFRPRLEYDDCLWKNEMGGKEKGTKATKLGTESYLRYVYGEYGCFVVLCCILRYGMAYECCVAYSTHD